MVYDHRVGTMTVAITPSVILVAAHVFRQYKSPEWALHHLQLRSLRVKRMEDEKRSLARRIVLEVYRVLNQNRVTIKSCGITDEDLAAASEALKSLTAAERLEAFNYYDRFYLPAYYASCDQDIRGLLRDWFTTEEG